MAEHEATGIASGIGGLHEFEVADHVLVVHGDAVEFFEQIERKVGTVIFDRGANHAQIALHAQYVDVVAHCAKPLHHVVFGAEGRDFLLVAPLQGIGWDQVFMHENEDAQLLHSKILWGTR